MVSNKTVTENDIDYTVRYYKAPKSISGVVDESYAAYDETKAYTVGEYCIITELKGIYRSSADSNTGNYPPSHPDKWTFWSPINSYRMLAVDEFIGSKTTGTDIVMEFTFDGLNSFGLIDIDFGSLHVELIDDSTGAVVWDKTYSGSNYGAVNYYEYFYGRYWRNTRVYDSSLPLLATSTLRFTFAGAVSIGTAVIGTEEELGCTIYGTSLRFEDTSTIKKSEVTGFRTVTRYGNIRIINAEVMIHTSMFNTLAQRIDKIIGHNILFLPNDDEKKFQEMITIGYFENFDMPTEESDHMRATTTIIGVL